MARRIRAAAAVSLIAILSAGCGSATDNPASYRERGYPAAPAQHHADTGYTSADLAGGQIDGLADPIWVIRTAERTEIPERVLTAYAGASLRMSSSRPGCGIGWNTLAGIGAVESIHGSWDGASVGSDGTVTPSITGVPLDGSDGLMAIPDTDEGALDGDPEWDRAVGPMQFIPTTWRQYAQDGNDDGETNPHQIDDAVLTAAAYLCERGEDLSTDDGWNTAITAYNQSRPYARDVADHAAAFAELPNTNS
ncbi:transglycosylase protein with SLT domain [Rhodococcus rhodochrous J45]|uniref:Transglycosylase protein with SLT domain n=1 Tax=Rhodococcus rhodochrous J45 TaxID=935266 RepID=A0A562E2U5_RHORH|nr:lytic murein transglycosylase [Rhodococcus rhodochrous]TWH16087.1 transglycosylase protein with SLT domain [Rhodococcus rhodochrous J45]